MSKLDDIIKDVNRQYKENIATKGIDESINKNIKKLNFSSPRANYMTYGGIPRGRIIEFAGEEGGGKTTTALDIVANAQTLFKEEWLAAIESLEAIDKPNKEQQGRLAKLKAGKPQQIVYADCENTLDSDWAENLGVNMDDMILLKPQSQTAEQIFEILLTMMESGEVGLVVIDSLGVMLSGQAYEKTMEEKTYGGIAAALTLFSKKAGMVCGRTNCTLIGINQIREDMNSMYGGVITTGGKAWKHNCSVRILFQKGSFIDERGGDLKRSAEAPAGNLVMMNIAKTKVFKPDRRVGYYTLNYAVGIDAMSDTVEVAIKFGIVQQGGSWFTLVDLDTGEIMADADGETIKIQGKANLLDYLEDNPELLNKVVGKINSLIN